jgi:hypothetical protein
MKKRTNKILGIAAVVVIIGIVAVTLATSAFIRGLV